MGVAEGCRIPGRYRPGQRAADYSRGGTSEDEENVESSPKFTIAGSLTPPMAGPAPSGPVLIVLFGVDSGMADILGLSPAGTPE